MKQESHVFNQIKFSKLAVKTGLLWFIPVYQAHERETGEEKRQAAVASIRKAPLISTAPSVTKSNSHSLLIWFSSVILILPLLLWKPLSRKSFGPGLVKNWILWSLGSGDLSEACCPLKCIPGKRICFQSVQRYRIPHIWKKSWGEEKREKKRGAKNHSWWWESRLWTWKQWLS